MKQVIIIAIVGLALMSCSKSTRTTATDEKFIKIDNVVFSTKSSSDLKNNALNIDTLNFSPYVLNGFGSFAGKSRTIKFSGGGSYQGVPVTQISGWDDFGYAYVAKDTAGNVWDLYRKKFGASATLSPQPISMFTSKNFTQNIEWDSFVGWERGNNTQYFSFKTKILGTNASSSNGTTGCLLLEYSAPDYIDTIFFKPGKGPVEILSWRAHLHQNNLPGRGGYR